MRKAQAPFHDPIRARHVVLIASVVGLKRAHKQTGVLPSQISTWRKRIERDTGETFPRLKTSGNAGHGKLSLAKARIIRARCSAGISSGVLARIYGVHPNTIVKIRNGQLYPEPQAMQARAA